MKTNAAMSDDGAVGSRCFQRTHEHRDFVAAAAVEATLIEPHVCARLAKRVYQIVRQVVGVTGEAAEIICGQTPQKIFCRGLIGENPKFISSVAIVEHSKTKISDIVIVCLRL
jgi:hypothetical protein